MIYHLALTCPQCGGELSHQTGCRPDVISSRAVVACAVCGTFLVEVTIRREGTATSNEMRRKAMRDRIPV